jgi:hypothetical protein
LLTHVSTSPSGHEPTLREAVVDGCSHPDLLAARVTLPCFPSRPR